MYDEMFTQNLKENFFTEKRTEHRVDSDSYGELNSPSSLIRSVVNSEALESDASVAF